MLEPASREGAWQESSRFHPLPVRSENYEVPFMGEAKHNRKQIRARMLSELERWMVPESEAEARLNDEIRAMTFYSISRQPDHVLDYMRMKPQQCHHNAASCARLDPSGESKHVSGWWKRGGIFFFHSVILSQTKLHCITPHHDNAKLEFAPDFDIIWHEKNGVMTSESKGQDVPYLVRDYPEAIIKAATEARDALLAGADPRSIKLPLSP
ncbi:hypothetical protein [Pannonibacter phragmitetus]|uniref:hypothetical protein n=1 Tax=Pannonibacter phragmitetus TaxID=121719 RepID=UPI0019104184|nr:hypothetical protein [Pannonibacter phragmitetus]